jgi:hypothetical protein
LTRFFVNQIPLPFERQEAVVPLRHILSRDNRIFMAGLSFDLLAVDNGGRFFTRAVVNRIRVTITRISPDTQNTLPAGSTGVPRDAKSREDGETTGILSVRSQAIATDARLTLLALAMSQVMPPLSPKASLHPLLGQLKDLRTAVSQVRLQV